MTDLSTSACADNTIPPLAEPSDLAVAIDLAERMLDSDNPAAIREALRILLRAVEQERAQRSVERAFPAVAAFLANERGERQ